APMYSVVTKGIESSTRLVSRLVASHAVLPGVLMGVLAFMLAALIRMNGFIDQVRKHYLDAIDEDEDLHRAGWAAEIAGRHGLDDCGRGSAQRPASGRRFY